MNINGDKLIRVATTAAVSGVAGIAAVVSYSHVYDLGRTHGQAGTTARLLPLSVDGLILAASLVLLHEARQGRSAPALARGTLWLGVSATIAANALYGLAWGALGIVLSAWPGAAFVGSAELLMGMVRRAQTAHRPAQVAQAVTRAAQIERELAQVALAVTRAAWAAVRVERRAAQVAQWAVQTAQAPAQDEPDVAQDEPADPVSRAIRALRDTTRAGNPLSGRQLAQRYGLSKTQLAAAQDAVPATVNGYAHG